MYEFKLPDIGEGLHEAELLEWDVKVGDKVAEGDSLAQISTDKVNVELPSPRAGVIAELPWNPGDVIAVGEVLARIDDGKSDEQAPSEKPAPESRAESSEPRRRDSRNRVKASPAVRRFAAEKGVDLSQVAALAAGDAVTREDIDLYLSGNPDTSDSNAAGVTRFRLAGPRLAAARRLEESWRTLATTAMTFEVRADGLLSECERAADDSEAVAIRVTPLAIIAKCVSAALGEHPNFNAIIDEKARALDVHEAVHLGIAVDSTYGLLVPVIRDAGEKSPLELAAAIADRAEQARSGKLAITEFRGSTFTISSTGSLEEADIRATTPVINFPNVATLWVSRIRERPRVVKGKLGAGPMMNCTLAFDHRFLHGADATRFLNTLDAFFGDPSAASQEPGPDAR